MDPKRPNPADHLYTPQESENLPDVLSESPLPDFTKVDNNLTGIGFFTASSKRSRKAEEKTTVVIEKGVAHQITIVPSGKYGLPITQDQDYWLALMKLVTEHIQSEGKLTNPFTFTTAELIKTVGQVHCGQNYIAVQEWADVMAYTGIKSGAYDAVRKRWLIDRTYPVFRFVTVGKELPEGGIADKNYIWFSPWQLDNINAGNLIYIDLTTYNQLKNNIAKNLVPHLQEWLFASRRDDHFEKRYDDLCQILGIRVCRFRSQIEEQLGPSLNELTFYEYISKWALDHTTNGKHFKLSFWPGEKFRRDHQARLPKKKRQASISAAEVKPAPPPPPIDETLVAELVKRGVGEGDARKVLARLAPGQPVLDQLEYADAVIREAKPGAIRNLQGFYLSRLKENLPNPPDFETSAVRKAKREAEEARQLAERERQIAEMEAEERERQALNQRIAAMDSQTREALFEQARKVLIAIFPNMKSLFPKTLVEIDEEGPVQAQMRILLKQGWDPSASRL